MENESKHIENQEEKENKIIEELRAIRQRAYAAGVMQTHEKVLAESKLLVEKYGEEAVGQCKLYHLLIGSTVEPEQKNFDINGELETFFRTELE